MVSRIALALVGGSDFNLKGQLNGLPMLRFTIRDVLWLMLVVGLVLGWQIDRDGLEERWSKKYAGLLSVVDQLLDERAENDTLTFTP